ncbi:MAG TPA: head GIN domain-containing protein [Pyrinomonadaceae bacterium]|nr:head GIN domain-containing protein [Pyrinomonadaceae bacterium]
MKRIIGFLSIAALLLSVGGCKFGGGHVKGSGAMKLEKREVPTFSSLEISGAYEVEIVAQKEQSLEIEGDDNLLSLIKTEVDDGVLRIYSEKSFNTKNKLRVRIAVQRFNGINTSGASDIAASGIKTDNFDVDASGASNINLAGETQSLRVDMSGAGELDAKELHAQGVRVGISGAARADVYATENLEAHVSGAGNVNYYGDPKNVSEDASGAGSISKK